MYYGEEIVEEILARTDIVDVVSGVVHMERRGANYFGLCPFHNEKTPSFSVSVNKQIYYCFGCGAGGNVLGFVMQYDQLSFPEAIEQLAERAGIALPEKTQGGAEKERSDRRKTLLEINREAATWYYRLLRSEKGAAGQAYFRKRGLSVDTCNRFGLGFAPLARDEESLVAHLRGKGYGDRDLIEAGVAVHDERRGLHDRFWNRVMFPIQDVNKKVIGFGGRVTGDGEPKYLNSPETKVFDKGRNLYALCFAKNARKGRIILCEGYMDVIALHAAGFEEAVASLGTAFTIGQANILKRYTEEVYLCYDSDAAGTKAALRGIGILKEAGLRCRVLDLSPCKDPDELILAEGPEGFEQRLQQAENPFYYEVRVLERSFDLRDPEGKTRFHTEIATKLCMDFEDALTRDNYLQAICARYHIRPEDMKELTVRVASSDALQRRNRAATAASQERPRPRKTREEIRMEKQEKPEKMLLTWLSDEPAIFPVIQKYISPEDFSDALYREVAARMFAALAQGKEDFSPARLLSAFPDGEEQRRISSLFNTPLEQIETSGERAGALHDILYDIMRGGYERRLREMDPSDADFFRLTIEGKKRLEDFAAVRLELP